MNTNHFSLNKSYPEPKIIEYDLEETSTDSSPQHTSSLYSESTDQDSESIHPNNVYLKHTLNKPTECHITKESKTILSSNQDYPVPSQFADLSLNRNDSIDNHHSILHNTYSQVVDADIVEDIPLSDNIIQHEIESNIENPELQTNEQKFDYYANKNESSTNKFNYQNEHGPNPYLKSKTNPVSFNMDSSSDKTNLSQFNEGLYFSQPNSLDQSSSLNSPSSQTQSKPLFPYNNTEILSHKQESSIINNLSDCTQSGDKIQQNKLIFQNLNAPTDIKLQSNIINSNNQSTPETQILNNQNNFQSISSSTSNLCKQQNLPYTNSINQQLTYSSSKSSASEFLNDISSITNQQFTIYNSSLTSSVSSTQSVGPITSATISTLNDSSTVKIKENYNESQHQTSDDQASQLLNNLSKSDKNSLVNSIKQDLINTLNSKFDIKPLQTPNDNLIKNQQETIANHSSSIYNQSNESQTDYVKSLPPITITTFTQPNNLFNSKSTTSQIETTYYQSSQNQLTSQQSENGSIQTPSDMFSNNSAHVSNLINHQNLMTASTVGQNVGNYFYSTNTSNQSVFNHQSSNLLFHSQQNSNTQDVVKPITSSFPHSEESKHCTMLSHIQSSPLNSLSVNQKSPLMKKESDLVECVELDSSNSKDILKLNSIDSVKSAATFQSNKLNVDLLENTEIKTFNSLASNILPPNDQFSSMTIDNQQNLPVSQTFVQEPTSSASYFSKGTLIDKKDLSLQNLSSTVHDTNYSTPDLSEDNNTPQSVMNKQTDLLSLNPDQPTAHSFSSLPINNESALKEQLESNKFLSQQSSNNKITSNSVPPLMSSNQSKLEILSSSLPVTNQYATSLSRIQSLPIVVPHNSLYVNQLSPQIFSTQSNIDNVKSSDSTSNLNTKQLFNNPPVPMHGPSTSFGAKQFPHQMFDNQPKSDTVANQYSSETSNNQLTSTNIRPPISKESVYQFASQMLNSPVKLEIMPPLQSTSGYPLVQSFNNQSIQNTISAVSSATNQLQSQMFADQPKLGTSPLKSTEKQCQTKSSSNQTMLNTVPPVSSTSSFLPKQMFNNASKSYLSSQTPSNQYPPQTFNSQPRPNNIMVPPIFPVSNQLPQPNYSNNQPKPDDISTTQSTSQILPQPFSHSTPYQVPPQVYTGVQHKSSFSFQSLPSQPLSQPLNNIPKSNIVPLVTSTQNQFSPHMVGNQSGLDSDQINKPTVSQYSPQSLSSQSLTAIPSIQQGTPNQFPSQLFSNQSKPNISQFSQSTTNQYPSQPFINQPGQQILSTSNNQQPPTSNQFYNPTNSTQLTYNQWTPHPSTMNQLSKLSTAPFSNVHFSNQANHSMLPQPIATNLHSNTSINQQTQKKMLPPNLLSANNFYKQGNENIKQSLPPTMLPNQNMQMGSKEYPQKNNIDYSSQINYQLSNSIQAQQGFQQQDPYRPEQNASVVQQGFAKTWGHDNVDLLKSRDVLPSDGVQPAEIKLPQGYANCDNCSPDIFRCTLNKFPSSKNLLDKSRLPLGILIHPYKDLPCLTVIQCDTITRCRNCRSYINPFVQFIDNAHWKCNLCYRVNDLPSEFQIDPYTKTLGDPSRRPEIQNATIEYIASQDYMVRPPQPALYLFLLDVSRNATLTGYLEIVCERILNKIMTNDIPGDSRTNIGFVTFDSCVHFYQIANGDGGRPKQLIVSDISDIFLPLPDGLIVNLEENKSSIKDLLTSLPNLYRESYDNGCALGAALQAAFKILAPRGGRVTVFQACLPNCGPGSLQARDDGTAQTGDRVQHMTPSTDFYKKLALECSAEQIAVDIFFVSSQYLDIATISGISKYSAGCVHNFSQFDVKSPTIVTRFINCFDRYLTRKIGFEALLRLRCTRGVAIHSFHGNFFVRSSDLLMMPNVNPDNAYGMQLSIEDNLDGVSIVCFQAALLYTSSNAERRIRVHTLCIPVTDNLSDVFHNADQQAITCLIAKMAVDRSTEKSLSDAREAFFNAISDSLSAFKLGCSSYGGLGTMLSPLSLRVFPLYILAMLKHSAFRTNQPTRLDDRMFSMCQMKSLPLSCLIQYIYPDLYPIHALDEQPKIDYEKLTGIPLPPVLQLSAERIESNGIYLMDDNETLTIFIGHRCSDLLIQKLFGYVNLNSMPELIVSKIITSSNLVI
ncbi:Hypothetical protein CINCED_3A010523 [Cinara cedri]|nr:Hypothetical protein CINCED_3A010523 [Cinara cedri]